MAKNSCEDLIRKFCHISSLRFFNFVKVRTMQKLRFDASLIALAVVKRKGKRTFAVSTDRPCVTCTYPWIMYRGRWIDRLTDEHRDSVLQAGHVCARGGRTGSTNDPSAKFSIAIVMC